MFMQAVVQAAEALDGGGALVAEDGVHLVEAELVVAGGDRGVGGEDALLLDGFDVGVGGVARGATPSRRSSSRPMVSRAAWPSFMWQTSGCMPRAWSRWMPPRPRMASWQRR